jgi:hypothetical protein
MILLLVIGALVLQTTLVWVAGYVFMWLFGITYNFTFWQAMVIVIILAVITPGRGNN